MRIILSRKGFDSSSGGCPNPILPDGRLVALPIPDADSPVTYSQLQYDPSIAELASQLSGRRMAGHGAHLDPDLEAGLQSRNRDWRPVLGQHGAAEGHLCNEDVGGGDLFLFFGLFRPVEREGRRWRFVSGSVSRHYIWGWLLVDRKIDLASEVVPQAYQAHPHAFGDRGRRNALYIAQSNLSSLIISPVIPGAGCFPLAVPQLCLTHPEATRPSVWQLPSWFFPRGRPPLSYHHKQARWSLTDNGCELQAVARGQEFVLQAEHYPEYQNWLRELFAYGLRKQ